MHLKRPAARNLPVHLVSSRPILPLLSLSGQVAGVLMMHAHAAIPDSARLLLLGCWCSLCSPGVRGVSAHICGICLRLPSGQGEEAVILCKRLRLLRCCGAAAWGLRPAAGARLLIIEGCGGLRLQDSLGGNSRTAMIAT